jgi:nucleotide-binding universal stress UspA family protein
MIVSIRKILFPTDFSEPAQSAQTYAVALSEKFGAELHAIHVVPEVILPATDTYAAWTLPEGSMQHQIAAAESSLKMAGLPVATLRTVTVGFAVEEIMKYATDHEIDLIVVGTHGHTGLSHMLLGSVAEKLVRLATCPVLTVHPQGHQFVHAG